MQLSFASPFHPRFLMTQSNRKLESLTSFGMKTLFFFTRQSEKKLSSDCQESSIATVPSGAGRANLEFYRV